jgi:hypothetical protein
MFGLYVDFLLDDKTVWVEWDCGHKNSYRCDSRIGYDILVVDEPRLLKEELIAVGCQVERGEEFKIINSTVALECMSR